MINGIVFILLTLFISIGSVWAIKQYKDGINYLSLFLCGIVIMLSFYVAFDFSTRDGVSLKIQFTESISYYYEEEPMNRTTPNPNLNTTAYQANLLYYADKEYKLDYVYTDHEIILIPSENTPHLFQLLAVLYSLYGLIFATVIMGIAMNMFSLGAKRP